MSPFEKANFSIYSLLQIPMKKTPTEIHELVGYGQGMPFAVSDRSSAPSLTENDSCPGRERFFLAPQARISPHFIRFNHV